MIPKECKRLAEVDFPIAEVSRHAVREKKSPPPGHPSKLHKWWAQRPLASSRAVLLALLLPDPCDPNCPEDFKEAARSALPTVGGGHGKTDADLRRGILKFIADFANWDNAANTTFLKAGYSLVKAAHGEEPPLVVDPFAGGGSIPLEALRLGCEAFASDLNPVACLILKVMLEDIPRHGPGLAEELRRVGGEIKRQAEQDLAELYPKDPDGAIPIVYLWVRTVCCEAPNCGAEIPLMRSFWLRKDKNVKRKRALRHRVERCKGEPPSVEFEVFEPKTDREVHGATVSHAKATCLCCSAVLMPERVRAQLAAQRGGADVIFDAKGRRTGGARMTAVVTQWLGEKVRHYRLPTDADYAAVRAAQARVAALMEEWEQDGKQGLCPIPDEPISLNEIRRISGPIYGITRWGDFFTARQKVALVELGRRAKFTNSTDALTGLLACALNVFARSCNGNARLRPDSSVAPAFGMQTLPITWAFPEIVLSGDRSENFDGAISNIVRIIEQYPAVRLGLVHQADATQHPLPNQTASIWFTDPPYYDSVPYAHLSDFFFVWLKRVLPNHPLLRLIDSDSGTTPKEREIVVDRPHRLSSSKKDAAFYEKGMAAAFAEGRRILTDDGVGSVVFAHKTTEGWEALLSGMIQGGWTITGSWPIATERGARLTARDTAALETSVHLICRPRPEDAPIGDWAKVLRELPIRVADWIERLQGEGIRGADLVFACIGPALEIFSRYRAVETAEGDIISLSNYLEKVWEVVGRAALKQVLGTSEAQAHNGLAGALEEDARLTALFLWTLQSTAPVTENQEQDDETDEEAVAKAAATGFSLPFDVVRRFAQPMGIDLDAWNGRIIDQKKGVVRLLPVAERAKKIFGEDGAAVAASYIESDPRTSLQQTLFPDLQDGASTLVREPRSRYGESSDDPLDAMLGDTTLDRVHTAMLLQSTGHANALRTLIDAEQDRGSDFIRLSNALSALYPRGSQEKRLLDAMLLAIPR